MQHCTGLIKHLEVKSSIFLLLLFQLYSSSSFVGLPGCLILLLLLALLLLCRLAGMPNKELEEVGFKIHPPSDPGFYMNPLPACRLAGMSMNLYIIHLLDCLRYPACIDAEATYQKSLNRSLVRMMEPQTCA